MNSTELTSPALAPSSPPTGLVATEDRRRHLERERRRAFARNVRHAVLAVLAVAAAVAVALAMRPRPVPVDLERARRGPLLVAIEENGMTRVKDRFVVSAPVTGSVSRLALEPGDLVKEGDLLAEIAPAESPLLDARTRAEAQARLGAALSAAGQARSQVARARVGKELADQELERAKRLSTSGSLPQQALESAEFTARMRNEELTSAEFASKVAAEEVRVARVALGAGGAREKGEHHVSVVSPVSGQVLRVHQKSGGVLQAGTPLVEVGDPAGLEVVADLLTTDAVHVRPGTPVVIQGWGGERPIAGEVRRIEPSAVTRPSALGVDEQRVNVVIAFTDPRERWASLGDGYRIEARLVLWQAQDVLKVPQGAVFRHGNGWAVFRVDDGVARLTQVRIGHRGEAEAEVLSGLSSGAAVAEHPGDRVKDGVSVEPR